MRTILITLLLITGCATHPRPLLLTDTLPYDWKTEVGWILTGSADLKDDVYTVTVPRPDLDVKIDGMPVPNAAGIFSTLRFYHCACGKVSVLGEIICEDFESNDVIDTLHVGSTIHLAGVGPIALGDKPRLLSIRFQGEGDGRDLAKRLKAALEWTGEARSKPNKLTP